MNGCLVEIASSYEPKSAKRSAMKFFSHSLEIFRQSFLEGGVVREEVHMVSARSQFIRIGLHGGAMEDELLFVEGKGATG